jgi:hypothetical protein
MNFSLKDNKDQWVNIERGLIVYIAFLKGADNKAINDAGMRFYGNDW